MDFENYSEGARRSRANDLDDSTALAVAALGLAGEAGEIADLIKKHLGHGHDLDTTKVREELGDLLWYVATLADLIGFSLRSVADSNLEKLCARYPNGFSAEASQNRVE